MLDQKLKPWLLEVNHHPSLGLEEQIDKVIKGEVVFAARGPDGASW
jgi:hypothetical protein